MSDWKQAAEGIFRIPFSTDPLSADVFSITGKEYTWLYDVGASCDALRKIQEIPGKIAVVISHFHPDHMTNLDKLSPDALYLGAFSFQKTGRGTVVDQPEIMKDGRLFRLFPLPSTHAKGSVGLEVDETWAFIGDAAYASAKDSRVYYNATLLKDTIDCIASLKAPWLFLSHAEPVMQRREDVLAMLRGIYAQRRPDSPDIYPR